MNKFIKNVSYLMVANLISFLISTIVTLIIPKFLSVNEYSYFQLYLFYVNYLGFFCIGWIDGIVLRYGGKDYDELDKNLFSGQFRLYSSLEIFFGCCFFIFAILINTQDINKFFVYIYLGIAIILVQINAFFRYLRQAVNSVDVYAQNLLIEKIVYIIGVLSILLFKRYDFKLLIYADLFGKFSALLHMIKINKDIVLIKTCEKEELLNETKKNISVGIKLLLANGSSLLIVGVIRYAIQYHWDVEIFGKVSLSLSVSNMFMIFVQAIGVSLFPMLRRVENELLSKLYIVIRHLLNSFMFGMLIFYYPAYIILSTWLPNYKESLHYLAIMFPICIFESKFQLLIEPYLKSLREEKELLRGNILSVLLSILCSVITIIWLDNLNLAVLSIVIVLGIRSIFLESIVKKKLLVSFGNNMIQEIVLVSLFIIFNWIIGGIRGEILYCIAYVFYIAVNKKHLKEICRIILRHFNSRKVFYN